MNEQVHSVYCVSTIVSTSR